MVVNLRVLWPADNCFLFSVRWFWKVAPTLAVPELGSFGGFGGTTVYNASPPFNVLSLLAGGEIEDEDWFALFD